MVNKNDELQKLMGGKRFDVEHALGLYALSFYSLPAELLYNQDIGQKLGEGTKDCHIYLIGIVPKVDLKRARQEGDTLVLDFEVLGNTYSVHGPIPDGLFLVHEDDLWYLSDGAGGRFGPSDEQISTAFQMQHGLLEFQVVYVGQAYGKDGSRNALDRLKKHETLQKIALKGAPDGCRLQLLLIEVHPSNQMFTVFNPFAVDHSQGTQRIKQGLDKYFDTSEHERITLYEASLIRYFQPEYNIEFKNSFPSTNMKVLKDCYDKDFSSIIAEFCFDHPPFRLSSPSVPAKPYHIIQTDLHDEADRKVFFAKE